MTTEGAGDTTQAADARLTERLHPRSIIARSWPALVVTAIYSNARPGNDTFAVRDIAIKLAVILVATLCFQALAWRMTRFGVTAETVVIRSGVFLRQSRLLRRDRLQAVDIVRPLSARLLGLSEVRLEAAGAGESKVALRFLSRRDAEALRARLLAPDDFPVGDGDGADAVDLIYAVPNRMVLGSYLLSHPVLVVALPAALVLWQIGILTAAAFGGVAAAAVAMLESVRRATRWANCRLSAVPDGLHIARGLLDTRAQTVPRSRVHAVSLTQPLLWRIPGWVRMDVTVAGYGVGGEEQPGTLLPVAPVAVANAVLTGIYAHVDHSALAIQPLPDRARWRVPLLRKGYGAAVLGDLLVTRHGVLKRTTSIVPAEHAQSLHVLQGPWQRRLRLATVRADIAPGPVSPVAPHLDVAAAHELAHRFVDEMRAARRTSTQQGVRGHSDGLDDPGEGA